MILDMHKMTISDYMDLKIHIWKEVLKIERELQDVI